MKAKQAGARISLGLLLSLFLICSQSRISAQQVFGSIYGTVTDKSGGSIANAKVTITDLNKNTKADVLTNDSGNYNKGQLIPGSYQVEIEAAGFSKVISTKLDVTIDQAARFDASLAVGSISEQVEVTAAAPLLQSDRADVAQTYTAKEVSELPNFGRNVQSFELLTPGTSQFGWNQNSAEDPQGGKQIQVNGQAFSATGFQLDGTSDQDPILGEILINPPIDAIGEVKQASQDYDAEFGYVSGGMLTYSTKSGSNSFHGSAFEYLYVNTPGFQDFGRNPFNSAENNGVPTVHWNQFGGSIGGKIIKNKLFFFGDAQLTRRIDNESVLTTVPTNAARSGDFSGYINNGNNIIYDPTTGDPSTGLGRTAFPNNTIPQNRLSKQAVALLNYFPLPNTVEQGSGLTFRNNYATTGGETFDTNQWDTRWDYYQNEKNTYFGRYSYAGFTIQAPGAFGLLAGGPSFNNIGYAGNSDVLNQSLSAGWTHTANPTLVNELRFGYMRYRVNAVPNGVGSSPATAAGIPGLNLDNYFTSGMPAFFINGDQNNNGNASLGYALNINSCNCPLAQREQQYQVVDNVNKILGNHNLKFGGDVRYALNLRVPSDAHRSGELTFGPSYTGLVTGTGVTQGYGLASFLLGETTSFRRYVSSSTDAQERQNRTSFYAQDAWRVNSKLTVTYGLRWELVFPETVNAAGNGSTLDLATGDINVFGIGNVSTHGIQNMNWHIFAPRLGVAYQITPKTVVRMGVGVSYSMGTFGSIFGHNVTQNLPVLAIQSLNAPQSFSGCL